MTALVRNNGFTLIEMMIAITIGITLMAGIGQIYLSSKQSYTINEELINFQENGRYITNRIAEEIRMAGHAACLDTAASSGSIEFSIDFIEKTKDFYKLAINAFEFSDTQSPNPKLPTGNNTPDDNALNPPASGNSDIISMQYGSFALNEIAADMASNTSSIAVSEVNPLVATIKENDFIMIADCDDANVFIAQENTINTLITHNGLTKHFIHPNDSKKPVIMHFISNTYYVGVNNGIKALYVRDNTNADTTSNTAKIFEGIESMDIIYGVNTKKDGNAPLKMKYLNASELTDNLRENIVSVKITFKLRSLNKVDKSGGEKEYMEKEFTSTIALRNQGDW